MTSIESVLRLGLEPESWSLQKEVQRLVRKIDRVRASRPSQRVSISMARRILHASATTARCHIRSGTWPTVRAETGDRVLVDLDLLETWSIVRMAALLSGGDFPVIPWDVTRGGAGKGTTGRRVRRRGGSRP